jgi:hypothetical protein
LSQAPNSLPIAVNVEQITFIKPSTAANTATIYFAHDHHVIATGSLQEVMNQLSAAG